MRILQLNVDGYRSLRQVSWKPGSLNVVIGPNGSGKSNLLRFLELISIAAKGGLGKYIQSLGGIEPLLWDGMASSISLELETNPIGTSNGPERYELELSRLGFSSAYTITHERLANWVKYNTGEKANPLKYLERTERSAVVFDANERHLIAPLESVPEDETLLSVASGPFVNNPLITRFQSELSSMAVYHDLHVNRDAAIRQPSVARTERRVDPNGQNLIPVLHTLYTGDRDFKRNVDAAMRAAFGEDYEELVFPPAADQRIQLRVRWKSLRREQSAAEIPDGMLRFLFLLTVLATTSPAPIIAIDEPETGLHPSMLPIVAEYAVATAMHSQVILTTHSPQFLDAFTDTVPTTTVAKWLDGATSFQVLEANELSYWLQQYSLGTLFKSGELEEMQPGAL